jgi:ABC-type branched-subunit amino acid transport system substrate-binding protein
MRIAEATVLAVALLAAGGATVRADGRDEVVVGVLLPADAGDRREMERGAAIAAAESESAAGPRVRVVARAAPRAWGAESDVAAKLLYDDDACGIVAPPDRTASHLAAQFAAKARAPVATLSTARALTRVPLPWVVRVVPDETATLAALLAAVPPRKGRRVLVAFVAQGREGDRVAETVARAAAAAGFDLLPAVRPYPSGAGRGEGVASAVAGGADAALLAAGATDGAAALRDLRAAGWRGTALAGPSETAAIVAAAGDAAEGLVLPRLFDPAATPAARAFREAYVARFSEEPGAVAAAARDGVLLVARASKARGGTNEDARAALLAVPPLDGATGRIAFDSSGDREGAAPLACVRGGRLVPR